MERAGIPLLAGTDVSWANPYTFAGFSLHDELSLLVEGGLTPYQALRTATINPARFLHATDSLGTVEVGKLADLVLLDADPLQDIRNTRKVHAVFLNGQLIDSSARQALLARAAAAVTAVTVDSTIR